MIHAKNKTALLELKKDLELVHSGAQILEEKRNILLKEIISLLDEVEEEREKLNKSVRQSYQSLIKAFMESGKVQLKREAALPVFNGKIHVYEKSFIGITTSDILALAEIEFKAWRLAAELKKTVVRVNALQKYYVPEYDKAIKETTASLEEVEREFLLVIKKSKER